MSGLILSGIVPRLAVACVVIAALWGAFALIAG